MSRWIATDYETEPKDPWTLKTKDRVLEYYRDNEDKMVLALKTWLEIDYCDEEKLRYIAFSMDEDALEEIEEQYLTDFGREQQKFCEWLEENYGGDDE